ncbi:MAG: PEP-CTERM sorting domain-containing protein [Nitrospirota bacterium]|nr:PEP-CTERM sorting domain-containing protein [Nitrospirota bacterium]
MKKKLLASLAVGVFSLGMIGSANAALVDLAAGSFTPAASVITFSEYSLGTTNPVYNFGTYSVSFDGYFMGGLGTPTVGVPLALDAAAPNTFITSDGANPTSPVLSGTPRFAGSVAVLFSQDVAAVGLDGGYFDAIGGTTIAAYDRLGHLIGSITNSQYGIEFFGLGDSSGNAVIAGIQFYITGSEPAGYAIDNLTFAFDERGYITPNAVPEPSTMILLGIGIAGVAAGSRFRRKN